MHHKERNLFLFWVSDVAQPKPGGSPLLKLYNSVVKHPGWFSAKSKISLRTYVRLYSSGLFGNQYCVHVCMRVLLYIPVLYYYSFSRLETIIYNRLGSLKGIKQSTYSYLETKWFLLLQLFTEKRAGRCTRNGCWRVSRNNDDHKHNKPTQGRI